MSVLAGASPLALVSAPAKKARMRGITFAAMALVCSGCLEPRSCIELYTCPPDDSTLQDTPDASESFDAAEGHVGETSDATSHESSVSSTGSDGAVRSISDEPDAGSTDREDSGVAVCGDGVFGEGEICDDGNTADEQACAYGQATCIACNAACTGVLELTGPTCGDGVVTDEEACDQDASWCDGCKIGPMVDAGSAHNCMVLPTGTIRCWGRGTYGQLGSGVTSSQNVPVQVTGLSQPATAVAAGNGHSCALLVDGSVRCWGDGVYGQIGNGEKSEQPKPTSVVGLESGVSTIAAAGDHTCALKDSGQVVCWGFGASGQLGNGSTENQAAPIGVEELTDVTALAAGTVHMCAVLAAGTATCWGYGSSGQLGDGVKESSSTPVAVEELTDVVQLAAGAAHTCALLSAGQVKCWGAGTAGQIGNGEVDDQLVPTAVENLGGRATALTAGDYHTCALLEGATVKCWGAGSSGQLGNGLLNTQPRPVAVDSLNGVVAVVAGASHTCALRDDGSVRCWGAGTDGQLGNGLDDSSPNPVEVLEIE